MKTFYVSGGILEVQPNEVTILSDTALREDDLDEERALEAERQAKEAMKNSDNEIDTSKAKTELMQAAAQLRLIKKLRSNTKNKGVVNVYIYYSGSWEKHQMKANKSKLLFNIAGKPVINHIISSLKAQS